MPVDAARANKRLNRYLRGFRILRYVFLTVLILGSVGLGVGYAKADSNAAAFAAAGACSGSGRPGCAGQVPVDLVNAGLFSGRSTSYWLEVVGDAVPDQRVYLSCGTNDASFFMAGQGKGLLTAQVWQGRVASLTYNGTATCTSRDSPALVAQYWLIGLGIAGSLLLGWLVVIARTRIAGRRGKQLAALASAPFWMNALIFPIVVGVAGSHAVWLYLPAYAIGAAVELPFLGLVAYQRRRREARVPRRTGDGKRVGRKAGFVFFGVLVAGALVLLGFYIPTQANAFAYENAAVCTGTATSGCVQQVKAAVVDTGSYTRGSSAANYVYWIEISGPGIPDQQFNLGGGDPAGLDAAAQSAGTVTALLWQGRVVEVEDAGTSSPGPSTPLRTAADQLAGLYALFAAIVFWLLAIAAAKARSTRRRHLYLAFGTVLLVGGIFAFAPLLAQSKPIWWAYPLTCAIAAVVVLPLYWFVLVMTRRKQRRRGA